METILITVSVLSTLGVVAIVLSITNVLNKLKGKVDVGTMNDIERGIREDIENIYRLIDRSVEDIHNTYERKMENLEHHISKVDRRIDSRSDKLVDHMCREFNVVHEKLDNKSEVTKDSNKKLLND
jgi:gas vesicle protein|tara:strand:+ start:366 stop:743 length:378 start_codon:yes stop_codon:yes gene_type:complete